MLRNARPKPTPCGFELSYHQRPVFIHAKSCVSAGDRPIVCYRCTTSQLSRASQSTHCLGTTAYLRKDADRQLAPLFVLSSVEDSYYELDIGQALARGTSIVTVGLGFHSERKGKRKTTWMLQLGQKALDFRAALGKLSDDIVILYWHPVNPTADIAFITTTRTDILAQDDVEGIESLIKSRLLNQDEKIVKSNLWWSLTVPPDFESRIRGRLPKAAGQDVFRSVVYQAACWVLSEVPQ